MHKILNTEDGSNTLFDPEFQETLHSNHGALTESQHIFIQSGFDQVQKDTFSILEIGFGTGLNATLTLKRSIEREKQVQYFGIENKPACPETLQSFYAGLNQNLQNYAHQILNCEWDIHIKINPKFTLLKRKADFLHNLPNQKFDLIYFDPFSPKKHPEAWEDNFLKAISDHMNKDALLLTYSSKGVVKQRLRDCGLIVKRLQGPPGKRHIIQAQKI